MPKNNLHVFASRVVAAHMTLQKQSEENRNNAIAKVKGWLKKRLCDNSEFQNGKDCNRNDNLLISFSMMTLYMSTFQSATLVISPMMKQ